MAVDPGKRRRSVGFVDRGCEDARFDISRDGFMS
jgi:hypothetical protein